MSISLKCLTAKCSNLYILNVIIKKYSLRPLDGNVSLHIIMLAILCVCVWWGLILHIIKWVSFLAAGLPRLDDLHVCRVA